MYEEIKTLLEEKEKYLTELCSAFEERLANLEESLLITRKKMKNLKNEAAHIRKEIRRKVNPDKIKNGDLGQYLETIVNDKIIELFSTLGLNFTQAESNIRIMDEQSSRILTEVDILLENNECIMAVEVKLSPKIRDINKHIQRIGILIDQGKIQNETRSYHGALVGITIPNEVKEHGLKHGLYVITQNENETKIEVPLVCNIPCHCM
jgi:predicted AAA+ superfamily ATPase